MLGGVARGLAGHLGLPVTWVRLVFLGLFLADGLGALLYAVFWFFVPLGVGGVDGAAPRARSSRPRADGRRRLRKPDKGQIFALLALLVGAVVFVGNVDLGSGADALHLADAARSARASPWSGGRRTTRGGPAGWRSAAAGGRSRWPAALAGVALVGRGRRRLLRAAGLRPPTSARPAGRARRPRRHRAAGRPLPGPDDPGPLRGAPDAHPRPGARRGRRPRPRLRAAHPDPDPAQRGRRPARSRRLARAQERELRDWLYKPEGTGKDEDDEPDTLAEAVQADRRRGRGQARRPHRGRRRRRLPARRRSWPRRCRPRARRWSTPPSTVARAAPCRSSPRSRARRSSCPYATAARASTSTRYPPTAWASENRSSAAWSATAARRGCARCPDGGTEVELEMERAERRQMTDGRAQRRGDTAAGTGAATGGCRVRCPRRRPPDVPYRRAGRDRPDRARPASRSSARPPTSTRRSRSSRRPAPRSSSSTSTCPGGGGVEVLRRCAPLMARRRAAGPLPRAVRLGRGRGRHRRDPRRRPRLRHQDDHRHRPGRLHLPGPGGRRGLLARGWPASSSTPSPPPTPRRSTRTWTGSPSASARCCG